MWHAFIPSGGEETEEAEYRNAEGNHLGSWVARVNLDYDDWGIAVYGNHFFEDHSALQSTHIAGIDNYNNHGLFTGWQHWGMDHGGLFGNNVGAQISLTTLF